MSREKNEFNSVYFFSKFCQAKKETFCLKIIYKKTMLTKRGCFLSKTDCQGLVRPSVLKNDAKRIKGKRVGSVGETTAYAKIKTQYIVVLKKIDTL